MNLGGRAAFAVPAIAIAIALSVATLQFITTGDEGLITGWTGFRLIAVYTFLVALFVGVPVSFPAVLFGYLLPAPRWLSLTGIGAVVAAAIGVFFLTSSGDPKLPNAALFGAIGAFAAILWWLLVERHREEEVYDA